MPEEALMQTMQRDSAADAAALGFAVLLSLSSVTGVVLLATGVLSWTQVLVAAVGVIFGAMAPGRWLAAIGGAAAAGAVALLLPGAASPWTGALVLPGVAVGSWLGRRLAPGEAVPWTDAVLAGLSLEVTLLFTLGIALPFAVMLGALVGLATVAALGLTVALAFVMFAGWLHVRLGRWAYEMAPGRFGALAAGQALPAALLALGIGDPELIGILSVIVALRTGLIWTGYARAKAVANAARVLSISGPPPVAEAAADVASSVSTPVYNPVRGRAMPLGS
jgi:hypothetical protein